MNTLHLIIIMNIVHCFTKKRTKESDMQSSGSVPIDEGPDVIQLLRSKCEVTPHPHFDKERKSFMQNTSLSINQDKILFEETLSSLARNECMVARSDRVGGNGNKSTPRIK